VDVLYRHFAPRNKALANLGTSFLFFLACGVLVVMGSITAFESFQSRATSGAAGISPLLPQLLVPVGGLLLGLQGRGSLDSRLADGPRPETGRGLDGALGPGHCSLFGAMFLFLALGLPVAFTLGGLSLAIGYFIMGAEAGFFAFTLSSFGKLTEFTITALPSLS